VGKAKGVVAAARVGQDPAAPEGMLVSGVPIAFPRPSDATDAAVQDQAKRRRDPQSSADTSDNVARNRHYTSPAGGDGVGRVSDEKWIIVSRFVSKFLDQKVEEVLSYSKKIQPKLHLKDKEALACIQYWCIQHKMVHWARLVSRSFLARV
jgi:hypothetical protein